MADTRFDSIAVARARFDCETISQMLVATCDSGFARPWPPSAFVVSFRLSASRATRPRTTLSAIGIAIAGYADLSDSVRAMLVTV